MMDSINQTTGLCGCLAKFFDDLALLNYENQQNVLKKFKQNPHNRLLSIQFCLVLGEVVFGSQNDPVLPCFWLNQFTMNGIFTAQPLFHFYMHYLRDYHAPPLLPIFI